MLKLEELKTGLPLLGLEPTGIATIIAVIPIGNDSVQIFYRTSDGVAKESFLNRSSELGISEATAESPWSFDGIGDAFKLAIQAKRIGLAFLCFNPMLCGGRIS